MRRLRRVEIGQKTRWQHRSAAGFESSGIVDQGEADSGLKVPAGMGAEPCDSEFA